MDIDSIMTRIRAVPGLNKLLEFAFVRQFIKFGIVGLSNTILSYLIVVVCLLSLSPFKMHYDYFIANIVAFIISVAWSFYWNKRFVFKSSSHSKKQEFKRLVKTYIVYFLSGVIVTNYGSWFLIELYDINKYIAPLINIVVTVPMNFLLIKFWAMK